MKALLAEDPNDDQQRFWGLFQVKWQTKVCDKQANQHKKKR